MVQKLRLLFVWGFAVTLIGCATPGPVAMQVIKSDDGLSEISAPDYWYTRPNLSRNADLRVADAARDHYLLVTTYLPGEVKPMSFEEFAERVSGAIRDNLGGAKMSSARRFTIGERPAIEYEMSGAVGNTRLSYVSTVVDGRNARYHLVGWVPVSSDTDAVRRIMASFREADKRGPKRNRVNLDFKWPNTLASKASFHNKTSKRGEVFELQGDVTSSVKPAGKDQLLISSRVTNQKMTSNKNTSKDKNKYLQNVLKAALTDIPDYVVTTEGEFVRIENLAGYHKRVQEVLIKGLPKGEGDANARAKQMVQSLLTEQSLAVSMQDEWNNMAGNWAGSSFALGEKYEFSVPYQAPALGDRTFPMAMTQQLAGYVPCHSGAVAKSCVRIVQTSRVAGENYTRAMNDFIRKTVSREVTVTNMEVLTTLELVTDPKTLLPYNTHKKQTKRVAVEAGGKPDTSEEVEESSATYHY